VRAAEVRALVEGNTNPLEGRDELFFALRVVAAPVRVFDTENVLAAFMFGKQKLEKRISEGTYVKEPGWAWRKANADRHQEERVPAGFGKWK
jgi:hypothetical protein